MMAKAILHLPTGLILFSGNASEQAYNLILALPNHMCKEDYLPDSRFIDRWSDLWAFNTDTEYNSDVTDTWPGLLRESLNNTLELIDV